MRGSREISLVPSLHRASTDTLINDFVVELCIPSIAQITSWSKLCPANIKAYSGILNNRQVGDKHFVRCHFFWGKNV